MSFSICSYGQDNSNLRCKTVSSQSSFTLDSLTVDPSSIDIANLSPSNWQFDSDKNSISFSGSVSDSVKICYRVLPAQLHGKKFHRDVKVYDSLEVFSDNINYPKIKDDRVELFSSPGLNKNGSISRGISFGNNQSVFVNSNLNLQLEGKLTEDVGITAVISDQNIPFQPEGNTQQLQEFDKVYMNLYTRNATLTAGDLFMKNKNSYFMRYLKNGQGGQVQVKTGKDSLHQGITRAGVALSKGKFHSMNVTPIEGVSGPYKLRGPNGERFIIVLANSERVFLDGKRLTRGFNYDYVIDYNVGEITFTNNVIITKFNRIRVDFEFSDKNYNRTNINASHYQRSGKFSYALNYYGERDSKNSPVNITLNTAEQQLLSQVGDNLNNAVIAGVDTVEYTSELILYQSKDTVVNFINYTIFEQSTNPDSATLNVIFSDFGEGGGDYIKQTTTVNGSVFQWVAPDIFGNPTGRYRPVRVVPTPKKKQMVSLAMDYQLSENDQVYTEVAVSDVDENLFSAIDDNDNVGTAVLVGYRSKNHSIGKSGYKWTSNLNYEYNQKTFRAMDRFRHVDFDRDWSANSEVLSDNNMINGAINVKKDKNNFGEYRVIYRNKGGDVNGFQHRFKGAQSFGRIQLKGRGFIMDNENTSQLSDWNRLFGELSYKSKFLVPGVQYESDKNEVRDLNGNAVSTAMNFDQLKFFVRSADSAETKIDVNYIYREDNDTLGTTFALRNISHTANASVEKSLGNTNRLKWLFTFRNLEDLRSGGLGEETVMNRFDWSASFLKRHVRSELTVFSATGRELQREFIYIQVPMGEGTHNWLGDLDNNGLRDIDEFVQSINSTDSSNYVKTFVPTDIFIKAFTNNFNYRLNISAPRKWHREKGVKKILAKISNVSSWTINRKITDSDLVKRFLPFGVKIDPSQLLSTRDILRSTWFFNRSNPKYGINWTYSNSKQKSLLSGGFDSLGTRESRFNGRFNIKRSLNAKIEFLDRSRGSDSDFLNDRTYTVQTNRITPELSFQPTNVFRITAIFSYADKLNKIGPEAAVFREAGLQVRVNQVSKRTLNARFKYISIDHNQLDVFSATPLGFEMLEGLQKGANYTWSMNVLQRLAGGLQLNIVYEGRKSGVNKVIHIGRMQISALF